MGIETLNHGDEDFEKEANVPEDEDEEDRRNKLLEVLYLGNLNPKELK